MVTVVVKGDQACLMSCCLLGFCSGAETEKNIVFMKSRKHTHIHKQARTYVVHTSENLHAQAHGHKL